MFSKLQYISQGDTPKEQFFNIQQALDAGCNWVQLRYKNASLSEVTNLAEQVKKHCLDYAATFIINDYPQIAKEVDADGVHLGLTDMPVGEAKNIMRAEKIIGGTANTIDHVYQRAMEGCSYIGLGPLRFTTTKEKLSPILGLAGYKKIMNDLEEQEFNIPIYAIGGVVAEDAVALIQAGVYGIAVSGIITNHPDKKLIVDQFKTFLYDTANNSR